jgi:Secretion system C-terminal sorting domain
LSISTYPNPASDRVTVQINGTEAGPAVIQMTDAMGRKVGSWNLNEDTTSHKAEINVSKFNAGTYFIRAEMNGKVISKKVMKGIE